MWFLWPVPIFLAVAVIFVAFLLAGRRLVPGTFSWRRAFWCPFLAKNVEADFKKAVWDGTLTDVIACTAFSPPQDVRCEKFCLLLSRFPAAKAEVAAASREGAGP